MLFVILISLYLVCLERTPADADTFHAFAHDTDSGMNDTKLWKWLWKSGDSVTRYSPQVNLFGRRCCQINCNKYDVYYVYTGRRIPRRIDVHLCNPWTVKWNECATKATAFHCFLCEMRECDVQIYFHLCELRTLNVYSAFGMHWSDRTTFICCRQNDEANMQKTRYFDIQKRQNFHFSHRIAPFSCLVEKQQGNPVSKLMPDSNEYLNSTRMPPRAHTINFCCTSRARCTVIRIVFASDWKIVIIMKKMCRRKNNCQPKHAKKLRENDVRVNCTAPSNRNLSLSLSLSPCFLKQTVNFCFLVFRESICTCFSPACETNNNWRSVSDNRKKERNKCFPDTTDGRWMHR